MFVSQDDPYITLPIWIKSEILTSADHKFTNRKVTIAKIISGGQTGPDRATLDFAINLYILYHWIIF